MTGGHPATNSFSPIDTVRERCRALHLATWRCDTGGMIIEEPTEPGLAGLWLRTSQVADLVRSAALRWTSETKPEVINARTLTGDVDGCWLVPLVEERQRRRAGITIVMALGPAVLNSALFVSACRSSGLDEQATRATFRPLAVYEENFARQAAVTLRWMAHDVASMGEYQEAVRGFTSELTQSYETIDLLYALGRSMLDLNHPERFVDLVCDRLHETMPFGWMAIRFSADERTCGSMASQLIIRGESPVEYDRLAQALDDQTRSSPAKKRGYLSSTSELLSEPPDSDSRLLVQPILRGGGARGGELAGMMVCGDKRGDDPQVSSYDMQLLEAAAAFTGAFLENARLYREQQALFLGALKALTASIDAKDRYTCGHSERVALLAAHLAKSLGLDPAMAERVHICGLVHDVGKIGIPERVLTKPGRLTDEEMSLIKQHPEIGHRIIRDIPMMDDILGGVLHHHERWDGGGYPHGLRGSSIPLFARLLCLADTFDAMSSTRSYRAALPREEVLEELAKNAGSQFDPELTKLFLSLDLGEYDALVERHLREHLGGEGLQHAA